MCILFNNGETLNSIDEVLEAPPLTRFLRRRLTKAGEICWLSRYREVGDGSLTSSHRNVECRTPLLRNFRNPPTRSHMCRVLLVFLEYCSILPGFGNISNLGVLGCNTKLLPARFRETSSMQSTS